MTEAIKIKKELRLSANPVKARAFQRFFKTGKGQYGDGDIFLGITVPDIRATIRRHKKCGIVDAEILINSKIHEERLAGLLILINLYAVGDESEKRTVFRFYMHSLEHINSWDLVDLTAPRIVGEYLMDKSRGILYRLARSKILWRRRIAIIATLRFIKARQFKDTFEISKLLIGDRHDLIHKAVGWMLREVGKVSLEDEEDFLKRYYKKMPRTMLRYAIEKFPEKKRLDYLHNDC